MTVTSGTASAHPAGCSAARASHAKGASISASRRRRCRDAAGTAASLVASRSGDGAHAPVNGVVPTASTTGAPARGLSGIISLSGTTSRLSVPHGEPAAGAECDDIAPARRSLRSAPASDATI